MLSRLTILALYAAVFFADLSLHASVLASPLPLPWTMMAPDYGRADIPVSPTATRMWAGKIKSDNSTSSLRHANGSVTSREPFAYQRNEDHLRELHGFYTGAKLNSQNLLNLLGQPGTDNIQGNCITQLVGFRDNLGGFRNTLILLAADKGLANYDRSNEVETLIKETANLSKDLLTAIYKFFEKDRTLGPVLGPLIYEIKCILDWVIDAVENLTDEYLNDLLPFLKGVVELGNKTSCLLGIKILGFCL